MQTRPPSGALQPVELSSFQHPYQNGRGSVASEKVGRERRKTSLNGPSSRSSWFGQFARNGRILRAFGPDERGEKNVPTGCLGGARVIRTLGTTDTGTCYTWIPRQLRAHLLPLNAASASSRSSENNTSKMPSDRLSCETVSWWCFKCLEPPCDGRYRGTAPPGTAQGDRRGSHAGRCAPRTRARRR